MILRSVSHLEAPRSRAAASSPGGIDVRLENSTSVVNGRKKFTSAATTAIRENSRKLSGLSVACSAWRSELKMPLSPESVLQE